MDTISEEEREQFLNAEGSSKSLDDIDNTTVTFFDGCLNKHRDKIYKPLIVKCKSVEFLREQVDSNCLHNHLSKSVNLVNDKQCIVQLSLNKLSSISETLIKADQGESSCTCREIRTCGTSGNSAQDDTIMHYVEANSKPGLVSVKLQHLNGQILPDLTNENESLFLAMQPQNGAFAIAYETSQSSDSVICRICYSAGDEKLIAPCKCAGSSRYVHEPCLVTWFKKSVKNECELCKSEVKIKKINHSLTRWRKPEDRPIPLIWFSVFFIGLFLNILSIHVNASEYCKSTACLIFYIVNGFGIILDSAFLYFWFLKCRHYCKKWFALNQDWFIDDLDSVTDASAVQYVRNGNANLV